jgi:hypothetical protein
MTTNRCKGKDMTPRDKVQQVYTLLVEVGRAQDDGLPKDATGAALVCYASGKDEEEAVRETVAILKQAGLAPIEVTGHGTIDERLAEGHEIPDEERALMDRALAENAVIVAQMEPLFGDEDDGDEDRDGLIRPYPACAGWVRLSRNPEQT